MSNTEPAPSLIRFDSFEVDLRAGEVRKRGYRIRVQDQPLRVLEILLEHPGQVVTRDELQRAIWPSDTFVDFDRGLNNAVKRLREALGDSAEQPRYVETIPRRGYRFIAPLTEIAGRVPQVRPQVRTTAFAHPKRWLAASGSVLLVATLVAAMYIRRPKASLTQAAAGKIMLAVLPFENLSGDAEQEYFSDGMTEEMVAQLSRVNPERLGVIARTSAMHYKGTKQTVAQIGRDLGASYILESSIRREGNRIRVTAQLVRTSDQTHVWAQNYDRDARELLPLESEVAQSIAREINIKLSTAGLAHSDRIQPVSPEAHEFYLKGRYFWNKRTEEGFWKGIEYFKRAIDKDPTYAQAYVGLADSYILLGPNDILPPNKVYPLAKSAARKALELDDNLAEAHTSLGFVKLLYDWNPAEGEREFRRAVELDPNYPTAHHWYAYDLAATGRLDEAVVEIGLAQQLDPLSLSINADAGQILFFARRYDDAIAQCQKSMDLDPSYSHVYWYLGLIYEQKGMSHRAVQAFLRDRGPLAVSPENVAATGTLEIGDYWRRRLSSLEAQSAKHYVSPFSLAVVYARMGDRENALANLERAYAERYPSMVFARIEPVFDGLRRDARFQALLKRIDSSAEE